MLGIIPSRTQWRDWTLPTKIGVIAAYATIFGLFIAAIDIFYRSPDQSKYERVDALTLPHAYVSISILAIDENDLGAIWFLPDNWGFSILLDSGKINSTDDREFNDAALRGKTFQSVAAFKVLLSSQMPSGSPDLLIESIGLQVIRRERLSPRPRRNVVFTGGGADAPVSFADFVRNEDAFWQLKWRSEDEKNVDGYSKKRQPLTFKYIRPGDPILFLVSEAAMLVRYRRREVIYAIARANLVLAGKRFSVVSKEVLKLISPEATGKDALEYFEVSSGFKQLQNASIDSTTAILASSLDLHMSRKLRAWEILSSLNGSIGNRIAVDAILDQASALAESGDLPSDEREALQSLLYFTIKK